MILLIDNYDSFSYNLYQLLGTFTEDIQVIRNDAISVDEIHALSPQAIIISPGPGHPRDAGFCQELIKEVAGQIPILGICLGHQAICQVFGADIRHAPQLMHGKQDTCQLDLNEPLFKGLDSEIMVGRYHSLIADSATLLSELRVIAQSGDEVMAVAHRNFPIYGLQFHPESILTPEGPRIVQNFLGMVGA